MPASAARVAPIPGTYIFDGELAQRGYALNKMCYSFNDARNREAFLADEDAYCARYGLTPEQREAVRRRDVLAMLAAGGNIYYLAKLAGIFGLDVQDIAAAPPVVPIAVNTVQHPLPKPSRCFELGKALGRALESYPRDARVVVIGTGGLSHQLDGERAGHINVDFDRMCLRALAAEPDRLARLSIRDLVQLAGTQGVELIMWLVMRGALHATVRTVHTHYHVPISNTAAGPLVLDNAA